jgi:hypothetical protein
LTKLEVKKCEVATRNTKATYQQKLLIDKETITDSIEIRKSSVVEIQVAEKGTNTNSVKEKTYLDVGIQTMEIPSVLNNRNSSINNVTSMHEENKNL